MYVVCMKVYMFSYLFSLKSQEQKQVFMIYFNYECWIFSEETENLYSQYSLYSQSLRIFCLKKNSRISKKQSMANVVMIAGA